MRMFKRVVMLLVGAFVPILIILSYHVYDHTEAVLGEVSQWNGKNSPDPSECRILSPAPWPSDNLPYWIFLTPRPAENNSILQRRSALNIPPALDLIDLYTGDRHPLSHIVDLSNHSLLENSIRVFLYGSYSFYRAINQRLSPPSPYNSYPLPKLDDILLHCESLAVSGDRLSSEKLVEFYEKEASFSLISAEQNARNKSRNLAQADRWRHLAASLGSVRAQYKLGLKYLSGEGVTNNDLTALNYLLLAAQSRDLDALYEAGKLSIKLTLFQQGIGLLREAASNGHCGAIAYLSRFDKNMSFVLHSQARRRDAEGPLIDAASVPVKEQYYWQLLRQYLSQSMAECKREQRNDFPDHSRALSAIERIDVQEQADKWRKHMEVGNVSTYVGDNDKKSLTNKGRVHARKTWVPVRAPYCESKPNSTAYKPQELFRLMSPAIWKVIVKEGPAVNDGTSSLRQGSAVAVSDRLLITNCHIADANEHVALINDRGVEMAAAIISGDYERDMCILESSEKLPFFVSQGIGVDGIAVGDTVYAIGAPHGLERTLSDGLISGIRHVGDATMVQTSAAIASGSSGGALFDSHGNMLGITTFFMKEASNISFAIPAMDFCHYQGRKGAPSESSWGDSTDQH